MAQSPFSTPSTVDAPKTEPSNEQAASALHEAQTSTRHSQATAPRPDSLPSLGSGFVRVPALIASSDQRTHDRYLEFFAAHLRNPNTREAYATAVGQFLHWCESISLDDLSRVTRLHVATYIEHLTQTYSAPTTKLRLAALRVFFDYLKIPLDNPASGVRGPKHIVRSGKTPVLSAEQARHLLDSITDSTIAGLRDRALIALMLYTFGRVSAVVGVQIVDYHMHSGRRWIRLHEKGGKQHALPVHHRAEDAVEAYLAAARSCGQAMDSGPLFRTVDRSGRLTHRHLNRFTAWEMVKRRANDAGLPKGTTNHSFRATGITVYLQNGGTIENARLIAAHASVKTTQAYDRRSEAVTLDEINRIQL